MSENDIGKPIENKRKRDRNRSFRFVLGWLLLIKVIRLKLAVKADDVAAFEEKILKKR